MQMFKKIKKNINSRIESLTWLSLINLANLNNTKSNATTINKLTKKINNVK
jgi:hypothetical protein